MNDDYAYDPSLRWNAETGELYYVVINEIFEKEMTPIQLNTPEATFAMDMRRRERGRARIETGLYKMFLAPVGQELPPLPPDELPFEAKYKPAIGVDLWNPSFGLVRLESTGAYLRAAIGRTWQEYGTCREAADGLLPVIRFVDRRPVSPKNYPNKIYYSPIIPRVGCLPREQIGPFMAKEPTVPLPVWVGNDSQIAAALRAKLEAPQLEKKTSDREPRHGRKSQPDPVDDDLDDEIPEL